MKTMKTNETGLMTGASRGGVVALGVAVLLAAGVNGAMAKKGGGGKPGGGGDGGGDPPPPPATATVEYELTMLAGFGGTSTYVEDVNSAGIAVGTAKDAEGTSWSFIASSDGMVTTDAFFADGGWTLPTGWSFSSRGPKLNEGNVFCGLVSREAPFQYGLVVVDLDEAPGSIEPVAVFAEEFRGVLVNDLNEHGDVLLGLNEAGAYRPHVYVSDLGQVVPVAGAEDTVAIAMNDHLAITVQAADYDSPFGEAPLAYRTTLGSGVLEDLSAGLGRHGGSRGRDITNDGTVIGHFDGRRSRTAGSVAAGTTAWTAIDGGLPDDATAAAANESGLVVGGYAMSDDGLGGADGHRYSYGTDLWVKHPVDGLFAVNDLVTGDAGEVSTFVSWESYCRVQLSEASGTTGYGVIAGTLRESYGADWHGFILTPKPVTP